MSHALQILQKCMFFEDNQMILLQFFYNSSYSRSTKKLFDSAIQVLSNPWYILVQLMDTKVHINPVLKNCNSEIHMYFAHFLSNFLENVN